MAQDATKDRLLEAAGEEFADKGFEGATVRGIIDRAKANIAAVNYHFGDKERLYVQAVLAAHQCGLDAEPDRAAIENMAPSEALRFYVRHFLSRVLAVGVQDTWQHRLMLREMLRPTHACEALVREVIRPRFEGLKAILRRARPDLDEPCLTASAFSVIGQCLHYKMARTIAERLIGTEAFAAMDLDFLADHIASFSLAALGLGPAIGSEDQGTNEAAGVTPSAGRSKR